MFNTNDEMTRLGWLHAAQVVDDALSMRSAIYTTDGIRMRKDFVARVRETDGIGIEEEYPWARVRQLLAS